MEVRDEIQFNTIGMMDIFGRAIYSKPSAAIRELIQNSNDAIIEYLEINQRDAAFNGQIRIKIDLSSGFISISDNGLGMNFSDARQHLNNFGISSKSMERLERLDFDNINPHKARNLIGRYGVGLLSALSISDKVIINTKHRSSNIVQWEYKRGDGEVTIIDNASIDHQFEDGGGTSVSLFIKDDFLGYFSDNNPIDIAKNFGTLLEPEIYLNDRLLNPNNTLLDYQSNSEDWKSFLNEEFDVIEGSVKRIIRRDGSGGELVNGVIFIPERTTFYRDSKPQLYINRMRVPGSDAIRNSIPYWARNFGFVINSNVVERQVSGEALIENESYSEFKKALYEEIVSFIKMISRNTETFSSLLGLYSNDIKKACIDETDLMDEIGSLIPLKTVQGKPITLDDYIEKSSLQGEDNVVYRYENSGEEGTAQVLRSSVPVPIINAVYDSDSGFIRKIAQRKNLAVKGLSALVNQHFANDEPVASEGESDNREKISMILRSNQIGCQFKVFRPSSVPAILVFDEDNEENKERAREILERASEEGLISNTEKILKSMDNTTNSNVEIFINTSNETIRELLIGDYNQSDLRIMILALYNSAYMFNFRSLTDDETKVIFKTTNDVISKLASQCNLSNLEADTQKNDTVEEARGAIVGIDLRSSTNFLNNLEKVTAAKFYKTFADLLDDKANRWNGFLSQFNGDGGFIFFPENYVREAFRFANECRHIVDDVIEELSESEKEEMEPWLSTRPTPRIVGTYGNLYIGNFGSFKSVIGKTVIDCWGVLEDKDRLDSMGSSFLVTPEFARKADIPEANIRNRERFSVQKTGNINFEVWAV